MLQAASGLSNDAQVIIGAIGLYGFLQATISGLFRWLSSRKAANEERIKADTLKEADKARKAELKASAEKLAEQQRVDSEKTLSTVRAVLETHTTTLHEVSTAVTKAAQGLTDHEAKDDHRFDGIDKRFDSQDGKLDTLVGVLGRFGKTGHDDEPQRRTRPRRTQQG